MYAAIVTSPLYWISLLMLLLTVCYGWYRYGLTSSPRPARVKPFFRLLLLLLPFLTMALQTVSTDQGRATVLIVQW